MTPIAQLPFVKVCKLEAGYPNLVSLLSLKNFLSPMGNTATIPPEYSLVTDGEIWNVKKMK